MTRPAQLTRSPCSGPSQTIYSGNRFQELGFLSTASLRIISNAEVRDRAPGTMVEHIILSRSFRNLIPRSHSPRQAYGPVTLFRRRGSVLWCQSRGMLSPQGDRNVSQQRNEKWTINLPEMFGIELFSAERTCPDNVFAQSTHEVRSELSLDRDCS